MPTTLSRTMLYDAEKSYTGKQDILLFTALGAGRQIIDRDVIGPETTTLTADRD